MRVSKSVKKTKKLFNEIRKKSYRNPFNCWIKISAFKSYLNLIQQIYQNSTKHNNSNFALHSFYNRSFMSNYLFWKYDKVVDRQFTFKEVPCKYIKLKSEESRKINLKRINPKKKDYVSIQRKWLRLVNSSCAFRYWYLKYGEKFAPVTSSLNKIRFNYIKQILNT